MCWSHKGPKHVWVFTVYVIHLHRGTVWSTDITIGDEDRGKTLFWWYGGTYHIQPMDISRSKSELSERWRVWLPGFTYFAEGKANLQNPARKRSELLYRAGAGVQHIFENVVIVPLPENQAADVYQQTVRSLNDYFHVQENAAYERHVLRQLYQELGEDVDLFDTAVMEQRNLNSRWENQLLEKSVVPGVTDQAVRGT